MGIFSNGQKYIRDLKYLYETTIDKDKPNPHITFVFRLCSYFYVYQVLGVWIYFAFAVRFGKVLLCSANSSSRKFVMYCLYQGKIYAGNLPNMQTINTYKVLIIQNEKAAITNYSTDNEPQASCESYPFTIGPLYVSRKVMLRSTFRKSAPLAQVLVVLKNPVVKILFPWHIFRVYVVTSYGDIIVYVNSGHNVRISWFLLDFGFLLILLSCTTPEPTVQTSFYFGRCQ